MNVDGKRVVLCYGDSNTYGFNPETGGRYLKAQRWTTILGDKLGDSYDVINEGMNGRTTAYKRPGSDWQNGLDVIAAAIHTHYPIDYLVIMLGTNDCNNDMFLEPEQIADGMRRLVLKAREVNSWLAVEQPEIIIVCPAAIRPELEGTPFEDDLDESSVAKSQALASLYENLADELDCTYVNASSLEVSLVDCEHLTAAAHEDLAESLYDAIRLLASAEEVALGQ
ncbi:MAG: hypothetical protein KBS68_00055 [Clostridiales bacterium]|nr:hypothetical protein [Candidatus Crickella merdequi]